MIPTRLSESTIQIQSASLCHGVTSSGTEIFVTSFWVSRYQDSSVCFTTFIRPFNLWLMWSYSASISSFALGFSILLVHALTVPTAKRRIAVPAAKRHFFIFLMSVSMRSQITKTPRSKICHSYFCLFNF